MARGLKASASALFLCALTASAQTGGAVKGRVISSLHGEPVANALVTMRELKTSEGAPQVYICQTGADGRFSIAGMAPGIYDPRPTKQGYETRPPDRFATAHDFPPTIVEAGKTVTDLELRLVPDAVIAGKVLDGDGDPVRYAQVELQQYGYVAGKKQLRPIRVEQTNDRGDYRFFYLPPGRYYLYAASTERSFPSSHQMNGSSVPLPSFMLGGAYYPGGTEQARATELQAQPGAELDGIDFHLIPEKRYSIRGKLPSGSNGGYPIRVVERSGTHMLPSRFAMTFSRDGYEVSNLKPGAYLVIGDSVNRAKPDERQYARQEVDIIDRDVEGVDLVYSPGVQVKGTVKVEGAAPQDSGNLALFLRSDFSGQQQAKIAADGTFASPQLGPGIFEVGIQGENAYVKRVRVGDREIPDRKIDVEHLSGDLTVTIGADFGRVEGTVTDEAGNAVYNANVTLVPDQRRADWQERYKNMFTLTDGKFRFANVQPGDYKVFAWLGVEPGAPQDADYRKQFEDRGVAVKVEANGRSSVDLKAIVVAK